MKDKNLELPKTRGNCGFLEDLRNLYDLYLDLIRQNSIGYSIKTNNISVNTEHVKEICDKICGVVDAYLSGYPSLAYNRFTRLMNKFFSKSKYQLKVYEKSSTCGLTEDSEDKLNLFRVRKMDNGLFVDRSELFHVPKESRNKIGSTRFSIAGYPSLYLSTNLELSWNEARKPDDCAASLYKIDRTQREETIKVIEMAIKPQDFSDEVRERVNDEDFDYGLRTFKNWNTNFNKKGFRETYLYCYPLIAACSFIRADDDNSFDAEYIVPQLLLQWVRRNSNKNLCGIRYFSCRDVVSSNMGFNYVFPAMNFDFESSYKHMHYCSILQNSFYLTMPESINGHPKATQKRLISRKNEVAKISGMKVPRTKKH